MATWGGFQNDLLKAAGLGTSTMQQQFIFDWNTAASSDCGNNPIDISRRVTGSSSCKKLTATRTARNYPSRTSATSAFSAQLKSGNFPHLLAALRLNNPYTYSNPTALARDLRTWGSPKMADYYLANANPGQGTGTGSSGGQLPRGHKGFNDFERSLAQTLPTLVRRSRAVRRHTLRKMGAPRNLG